MLYTKVTYPTPESITASMAAILGSGFTSLFTAIFQLFAEDEPPHHMKNAALCYVFLMALGGIAYCMHNRLDKIIFPRFHWILWTSFNIVLLQKNKGQSLTITFPRSLYVRQVYPSYHRDHCNTRNAHRGQNKPDEERNQNGQLGHFCRNRTQNFPQRQRTTYTLSCCSLNYSQQTFQ